MATSPRGRHLLPASAGVPAELPRCWLSHDVRRPAPTILAPYPGVNPGARRDDTSAGPHPSVTGGRFVWGSGAPPPPGVERGRMTEPLQGRIGRRPDQDHREPATLVQEDDGPDTRRSRPATATGGHRTGFGTDAEA